MRLVGFHSIRIHAISWEQIEPRKGEFRWEAIDEFMRLAEKNGFSGEQITFNIMGIPRWASTRPEATWVNVCIREFSTVMPTDRKDWENFLRLVVRRYPSIRRYELWNEPHLPGFSCFWADTPENFVKLLKSGYETVKQEKHDAVVWLGGIGMRYLAFYRKLLELGGGKYFDVLPLHGSWMDPRPFHQLERKYHVPEKPVVSSEWHAMLLNPNSSYPSERLLARTMLLDFLNQIRNGVEEVDFFCILNLPKIEKETLAFHRKYKRGTHVSGLFRRMPYIQPRYPAVAWHNFVRQIQGRIRVLDGYHFAAEGQYAQYLTSDNGPLLILWNGKKTPGRIAKPLLEAIAPSSELLNAEGKRMSAGKDLRLEAETYYILRNPDPAVVARWKNRYDVLSLRSFGRKLDERFKGTYRTSALFGKSGKIQDPDTVPWLPLKQFVRTDGKTGKTPSSGRFALAVSPKEIELAVEIPDALHYAPESSLKSWNFDSLQFAFDTRNCGMKEERIEILAVARPDGSVDLWKSKAAGIGGDLPYHYTMEGERIRFADASMVRSGNTSVYRIRIEASELFPLEFSRSPVLRFSILANCCDGSGRTGYLEWGSGIGGEKNPLLYGTLTVSGGGKTILSQKDLNRKAWNKDYSLQFGSSNGFDWVKVIGTSPVCSGVTTPSVPVVRGVRYRVRLEVRGSARFQMIAGGKGLKRLDLVSRVQLSEKWMPLECEFIAPPGAESVTLSLFAWKQPGCEFEVRKFSLESM